MRNKNILPNTLVPKRIRLQVYKEAIKKINSGDIGYKLPDAQICLLLPCLLWGLNHFLEDAPCGDNWNYWDTENMFPEINGIKNDAYQVCPDKERDTLRLIYLIKAIEKLTQ